jgi:hypothetical protein
MMEYQDSDACAYDVVPHHGGLLIQLRQSESTACSAGSPLNLDFAAGSAGELFSGSVRAVAFSSRA